MAGRQYLNRLENVVLDQAVGVIEDYLPEDAHDARDAVMHARKDVVARADATFKTIALVGALARVVAAQQDQIDELRDSLGSLESKGAKSSASSAKTKK